MNRNSSLHLTVRKIPDTTKCVPQQMTTSYSFQEVIVALPLGKLILRLYSWDWYEKDPALINSRFANLFSKYVDQARVYLLPRSQGVKAWSSHHCYLEGYNWPYFPWNICKIVHSTIIPTTKSLSSNCPKKNTFMQFSSMQPK